MGSSRDEVCWLVGSLLTLIVLLCLSASRSSTAQPGVLWQHDDSIATVTIDSGHKESDSYRLMSAFADLSQTNPSFKRIETADQKLRIYCAGSPNPVEEGSPIEASCHVELNFFKTVSAVSKNTNQVLLIQNPNDVALLSKIFTSASENEVQKFQTSSANLCIQCQASSGDPVCAVSVATQNQACAFIDNLKATSTENTFVTY